MFNLILNSPLSDVVAPPLSLHEEFIAQCESFTKFFKTNNVHSRQKCRIEQTNLAEKLTKICDIVVEEQNEHSEGKIDGDFSLCPSMEHLLQNCFLTQLALTAQVDSPLGIYPKILSFFIRLLNGSSIELIPHRVVYTSLNKLLAICGHTPASPYETSEILFLQCLTELIVKDSGLVNCFIIDTNCSRSTFPLVNSLLSFLTSPDALVAKRAGDTIFKLIPLLNENADQVICEKTAFCSIVTSLIIDHYSSIPRSLKADEVELAISSYRAEENAPPTTITNSSVRKFLSFLRWYKFFDILLCSLPSSNNELHLKKALLYQFHNDFLDNCILPDIIGQGFQDEFDSIDNIFLTTVLLSNCLRNTESVLLFNYISHFLLIPERKDIEQKLLNIPEKFSNHSLCKLIIERCELKRLLDLADKDCMAKHIKLASATLQLIEDIIMRPSKELMHYLILVYIEQRSYFDASAKLEDESDEVWDDQNFPALEKDFNQVVEQIASLPNISNSDHFPLESINRVLHLYHSLIPQELKQNGQVDRFELEAYLSEAIKGFHLFFTNCYSHWPNSIERPENLVQCNNSDIFQEAPFISIIFDNFSQMLVLPYEINLQICSILAKISLVPNKYLNEYLLDPTIQSHSNLRRNLFSILHQLIAELQVKVKGIEELKRRLAITKKRLLDEKLDESEKVLSEDSSSERILQCCIILDEFCKELCAIILAKHNIVRMCKLKI